jgi:hypothetical protein
MIVLYGSCGQAFSYILDGGTVRYLGEGDLHDREYDGLEYDFEITPYASLETSEEEDYKYCHYSARVYPSDAWKKQYFSDKPNYYAAGIVGCFVLTTFVFAIYDYLVRKRQRKVLDKATRSTAIVSNLFPSTVRDKLMEEALGQKNKTSWRSSPIKTMRRDSGLEDDSEKGGDCVLSDRLYGSAPIADFFPETTILFADMVGFTAWSSVREPSQVFTLLETVYHAFDSIARRRRVFKGKQDLYLAHTSAYTCIATSCNHLSCADSLFLQSRP